MLFTIFLLFNSMVERKREIMARPIKQGIDNWLIDVDFLRDVKVKKVRIACGPCSPIVIIALINHIHKDYGYFLRWDDEIHYLIADEVGVSGDEVEEVVSKATQVHFFDPDIYAKYKILTSADIQKRFLKAVERRLRVEVIKEYWLLEGPQLLNICLF